MSVMISCLSARMCSITIKYYSSLFSINLYIKDLSLSKNMRKSIVTYLSENIIEIVLNHLF